MIGFFCAFSQSAVLYTKAEELSFISWMREFNTIFTGDEYHFRLGIFLTKGRYIDEWNRGGHRSSMVINRFAAHTPSELRQLIGQKQPKRQIPEKYISKIPPVDVANAPESLDWREKGVVNNVQDCLHCSAGWAFAATSSLESCYAIANGKLYELSNQNLIDCCLNCDNCNGGQSQYAFVELLYDQDGAVMQEKDYPYESTFHYQCNFKPDLGVARFLAVINCPIGKPDETAALCASYGPIAAGIDADHDSFYYYGDGVWEDEDCYAWGIDHHLTIVGYGTEEGTPYWICRNCWGPQWGMKGYIKTLKDKDTKCGIDIVAVIPQVEHL